MMGRRTPSPAGSSNSGRPGRNRFPPQTPSFRDWPPPPPLWAIISAIIISIPIFIYGTTALISFFEKNLIRVRPLSTSPPPPNSTGLAIIEKVNLTCPLPTSFDQNPADFFPKGLPNLHIYSAPAPPPPKSENEVALIIPKPSLTCPLTFKPIIDGVVVIEAEVDSKFIKWLEEWHNQQHPSPIKSGLNWIKRQAIFMYEAAANSTKYFIKMICNCQEIK